MMDGQNIRRSVAAGAYSCFAFLCVLCALCGKNITVVDGRGATPFDSPSDNAPGFTSAYLGLHE